MSTAELKHQIGFEAKIFQMWQIENTLQIP
jgi:hypothetical protein